MNHLARGARDWRLRGAIRISGQSNQSLDPVQIAEMNWGDVLFGDGCDLWFVQGSASVCTRQVQYEPGTE